MSDGKEQPEPSGTNQPGDRGGMYVDGMGPFSSAMGMADILAFGFQPCWIELKTDKGKQYEFQKSFQSQVEEHGHTYILARSLEDVKKAFR